MARVEEPTEAKAAEQNVELEFTEAELVETIARGAEERGWRVKRQPTVDVMRPDLTIAPSSQMTMVVEVKREVGLIHFASLGQVSSYQRALGLVVHVPVYPVLVTTGEPSEEIRGLADELDVNLVVALGDALEPVTESALGGIERLIPILETVAKQAASRSSEDVEAIIQSILNLLTGGEDRAGIAATLGVDPRDLSGYYAQLLTKLEATEPERLDTVMNAWSEHAG